MVSTGILSEVQEHRFEKPDAFKGIFYQHKVSTKAEKSVHSSPSNPISTILFIVVFSP